VTVEHNKKLVQRFIDEVLSAGNTDAMVGLSAFGRLETPVPPTGIAVAHSGMYVFTLSDGKIVSYAVELDQIGLLR
jgi:hypothetical protein